MSVSRFISEVRGAGAVEFALVLPIFVLCVLAGLQFAWAQNSAGRVEFALERTSRALLLNPSLDDDQLRGMVLADLDPMTAARVTVAVSRETGAGGPVAKLSGVYQQEIGLPNLAALPFRFARTITTPIPNAT